MKILLSIKPEYALKIFAGTKKYEFRRNIFCNDQVKSIVVYASYPVQRVIGEFEIEKILNECPEEIWKKTRKHSGIKKSFFDSYFSGRDKAYAIKIKRTIKYRKSLSLQDDMNIAFAPQSFIYLNATGRS